jgi:hypothetical protein
MAMTLIALGDLFNSVLELVAAFFKSTNQAGGTNVIEDLALDIHLLAAFIASPQGQKAIEGFIHASEFLAGALIEIVITIGLLVASLESFGQFLAHDLVPGFVGAADDVAMALQTAVVAVGTFFANLWHTVIDYLERVGTAIKTFIKRYITDFLNIDTLFDAGRNLVQGLINGMLSKLGPIRNVISNISQTIRDHWPFSPAKVGPLSGSGDPRLAGQNTMARYAEGLRMEIPAIKAASSDAISNIVFGRDAIRVTFEGALPSQQQAQQTGAAVGAGINGQLAARNTRLAVRTL